MRSWPGWTLSRSADETAVNPVVADVSDAQRYQARLDGQLAGVLEYVVKRGRIALVHTEVAPDFEGVGSARTFARTPSTTLAGGACVSSPPARTYGGTSRSTPKTTTSSSGWAAARRLRPRLAGSA